jgi:2-oxoglutarate ferredoxin oxidoreductase subunit alpha
MKNLEDISLVLSGEAGKGLNTIERVLVRTLKLSGFHVFASKEYMSRVRGGNNTVEIRTASKPVGAFVDRIDILVPLNGKAIDRLEHRLGPETVIIGEGGSVEEKYRSGHRFMEAPFVSIAEEAGDALYANSVAAGVLAGMLGADREVLEGLMQKTFAGKGEEVAGRNVEAAGRGYSFGKDLAEKEDLPFSLIPDDTVRGNIILSGGDAVSLGAIAGGCSFISSYPMSPSTSVLVFLARHAAEFGLVAEQAEDEISAINMAIGAWYAGARGLVTTSGGGFALMAEGLSLAGMTETPVVIHLAQRPGPATGLPTRTEQGDLLFALRAGHGEFPRIILAPGTIEEAFYLSREAFNLADRFQVPVIILTDQHLIDSYRDLEDLDLDRTVNRNAFIGTDEAYIRYEITDDGISPRGVPGFGSGLVCVDSDEHDAAGRITEDREVRVSMVEKRLRKSDRIRESALEPVLTGSEKYSSLVVGWGSNFPVIKEALEEAEAVDTSFLHIRQVYPMHPRTVEYLEKAERIIVVENNATSQLGSLLMLETGIEPDESILKYDGHPFSVEELADHFRSGHKADVS